jgi:hypothetical protein
MMIQKSPLAKVRKGHIMDNYRVKIQSIGRHGLGMPCYVSAYHAANPEKTTLCFPTPDEALTFEKADAEKVAQAMRAIGEQLHAKEKITVEKV